MPAKAKETEEFGIEKAEAGKFVQLVIFKLGEEEFGVDIHDVREIMTMREITPVPQSPPFIEGIINIRGQIVVVINLEKRFLLVREKPEPSKHILIAEIERNLFGLKVDEVTEVYRLPEANIRPAPSIIATKIHTDYLKGVGIVDERLLILLDSKKVLSEKELAELAKLGEEYRRVIKAKEKPEEEKAEEEKKKEEKVLKKAEERWKEVKVEKPKEEKGVEVEEKPKVEEKKEPEKVEKKEGPEEKKEKPKEVEVKKEKAEPKPAVKEETKPEKSKKVKKEEK